MTTEKKVARGKLSLLELASELSNVSRACRIIGYSRQQFYEIRRNYQVHDAEGLVDRLPGPKGPHPNRVSEEVEKAVLEHSLANPTHGCCGWPRSWPCAGTRSALGVFAGFGRATTCCHVTSACCAWSKRVSREKIELKPEQIRLLERFSPEFRKRHIETRGVGELVAVACPPRMKPCSTWSGDIRHTILACLASAPRMASPGQGESLPPP